MSTDPKSASPFTAAANCAAVMSFDDEGDWERAQRGLIATHNTGVIENSRGRVVWDLNRYDFLDAEAPDTVHPGLWRQSQLCRVHGLFEVTDKVWQARGYDLSNITFIEGHTGWIIIDPLTTAETSSACLALANETLGERPVKAVIFTHSHADHFGGVLGVVSAEQVDSGDVQIIAPEGFLKEAVSENALAGPIMSRRAMFQFGPLLPPGPKGHVNSGLGLGLPLGEPGLLAPTIEIATTGEQLVIDGVEVVFQSTPDAEAPAEMNFYFPQFKAICMAENCTHTMHNLCPLRGAQSRDSLAWSKYIHEALTLWGDDADVMFSSHHWPRWGQADIRNFLEMQRDVYRFLHDETLRLANHGLVPNEIADTMELPDCYSGESHVRGYYGAVSHNAKSVYTKYLGWYDGNPANLDPLPPVDAAQRYVELMGGADAVIAAAAKSMEAGEYRWVVELLKHVVFNDPTNRDAREMQADAMEQLAYAVESSTWRNAYLQGAMELRHGSLDLGSMNGRMMVQAMSIELMIDSLAVRVNFETFGDHSAEFNLLFPDLEEQHVLGISRRATYHSPDTKSDHAACTATVTRESIANLMSAPGSFDAELEAGRLSIEGDDALLRRLFASLDTFATQRIIEP